MVDGWLETEDLANMSNWQFMSLYRDPERFSPGLAAKRAQEALETGYVPNPRPDGPAATLKAEAERRGLQYPQAWKDAGLL